MSITIMALPMLLLYNIGATIALAATSAHLATGTKNNFKMHINDEQIENLCNRTYQTQIMSEDVLIKTLYEHGAENILKNENYIESNLKPFHMEFAKPEADKPYTLEISYNKNLNASDELVQNLGMEYNANAQEASYNKIQERLRDQNLTIDEEEVYEDNTIVLTVNLE